MFIVKGRSDVFFTAYLFVRKKRFKIKFKGY